MKNPRKSCRVIHLRIRNRGSGFPLRLGLLRGSGYKFRFHRYHFCDYKVIGFYRFYLAWKRR